MANLGVQRRRRRQHPAFRRHYALPPTPTHPGVSTAPSAGVLLCSPLIDARADHHCRQLVTVGRVVWGLHAGRLPLGDLTDNDQAGEHGDLRRENPALQHEIGGTYIQHRQRETEKSHWSEHEGQHAANP